MQPAELPATRGPGRLLALRAAKSTHKVDDEADDQNQANATAADDRAAEVKATSAEKEKQDK